jgi:hypothetical protein
MTPAQRFAVMDAIRSGHAGNDTEAARLLGFGVAEPEPTSAPTDVSGSQSPPGIAEWPYRTLSDSQRQRARQVQRSNRVVLLLIALALAALWAIVNYGEHLSNEGGGTGPQWCPPSSGQAVC